MYINVPKYKLKLLSKLQVRSPGSLKFNESKGNLIKLAVRQHQHVLYLQKLK